jgi:hypothetical protein
MTICAVRGMSCKSPIAPKTEAAGRLPGRLRIRRSIVARNLVADVPSGIGDPHREIGQHGLVGQRQDGGDVRRVRVEGGGEELAAGRRRSAELQERERATAGAIVAQKVGFLAIDRRQVPVGDDLHAKRLLRNQPVERTAVQSGALEIGREPLRIAGQQIGTGGPEGSGREGPG